MRRMIKLLTLSVMIAASPAAAADHLACMEDGYDAQQLALQDQFVADYDLDVWSAGATPGLNEMMDDLADRADACADQHGWSPVAFESAVAVRLADLLYRGIEGTKVLSPAEFTQLTAAVDAGDRPRLYRIFGVSKALVDYEQLDPEALPPETDQEYVLKLVEGSGIPSVSDRAKMAGALIAARLMLHFSVERFTAN